MSCRSAKYEEFCRCQNATNSQIIGKEEQKEEQKEQQQDKEEEEEKEEEEKEEEEEEEEQDEEEEEEDEDDDEEEEEQEEQEQEQEERRLCITRQNLLCGSSSTLWHFEPVPVVGWLEFNVPFQHKYGYIRDNAVPVNVTLKT